MRYVKRIYRFEELIKKSKFIGVIAPTVAEADAQRLIQALHIEHPHASHVVYAYRILTPEGLVCRFYDAGEPGGTAGKPIFQHLEAKNIINTTVAVVRYFGGVKLGAGGLTRAYGNCAGELLDSAELTDYVVTRQLRVILDYPQFQALEFFLKQHGGVILDQDFAEQIRVTVELPAVETEALLQRFRSAS